MSRKTGRYSLEFKLEALQRMETCRNVSALARELNIRRKFLYAWRAAFREKGESGLRSSPVRDRHGGTQPPSGPDEQSSPPSTVDLTQRVAELEPTRHQTIGDRFFQTHLRACQGSHAGSYRQWRREVYRNIQTGLSFEGPRLTVERQCELAGVSRAGFYRHLRGDTPAEEEILVRERLQQLAISEKRRKGYRPLTHLLRREGFVVNGKVSA